MSAFSIEQHFADAFPFNEKKTGLRHLLSQTTEKKGFFFRFTFSIYKYIYKISMHNGRKPRGANQPYVKDYLKYITLKIIKMLSSAHKMINI